MPDNVLVACRGCTGAGGLGEGGLVDRHPVRPSLSLPLSLSRSVLCPRSSVLCPLSAVDIGFCWAGRRREGRDRSSVSHKARERLSCRVASESSIGHVNTFPFSRLHIPGTKSRARTRNASSNIASRHRAVDRLLPEAACILPGDGAAEGVEAGDVASELHRPRRLGAALQPANTLSRSICATPRRLREGRAPRCRSCDPWRSR